MVVLNTVHTDAYERWPETDDIPPAIGGMSPHLAALADLWTGRIDGAPARRIAQLSDVDLRLYERCIHLLSELVWDERNRRERR